MAALAVVSVCTAGGTAGCAADPPSFPESAETDTAETIGGPAADGSGDASDSGRGSATATTSNATSDGSSDGPQDGSGDTSAGGTAELVIDGPTDLGMVALEGEITAAIVVRNVGAGAALALDASISAGPFAFSGGAYPGATGTCAATLDPQQACTLEVAFKPEILGPSAAELEVSATGTTSTAATLQAAATGTTPNLLVNGNAEVPPPGISPPGWTPVLLGWETTGAEAHGGLLSIRTESAITPDGSSRVLEQVVDVAALSALTGLGVGRIHLEGWLFTPSNDLAGLQMEQLDAGGGVLAASSRAPASVPSWTELALEAPISPGLTSVAVRLEAAQAGTVCNAFYDDLVLTLSYP